MIGHLHALLAVELAPDFAAAAAHRAPLSPWSRVFPSRATLLSEEHADPLEYMVPLEMMPGSSNPYGPLGTDLMVLDHVAPDCGSRDLTEFEVPVAVCHEELTSQKDMPTTRVRSCVELLGYASGWVAEPAPTHSTILYSMTQVDRSPEAQVHGRTSTEQTQVALRMEPLVIQGPANLTALMACR